MTNYGRRYFRFFKEKRTQIFSIKGFASFNVRLRSICGGDSISDEALLRLFGIPMVDRSGGVCLVYCGLDLLMEKNINL